MSNFSAKEFECKCGCGLGSGVEGADYGYASGRGMDPELLVMLDEARLLAACPFIITSGLRCKAHNKASGGSASSSHLNGTAVDIATRNSQERHAVLSGLWAAGFARIGIANSFIHVDVDQTKPVGVVWTY